MAPVDLATALHKRYRKGALLFTFLVHTYSLICFGPNFAVKLRSCRSKLLTSIQYSVRNLKLNYMGGHMGGYEFDNQTKYEVQQKMS